MAFTHSRASNFEGQKPSARWAYSLWLMSLVCSAHSPCPSIEYMPQWMKMPKRLSSNSLRASRISGVGR